MPYGGCCRKERRAIYAFDYLPIHLTNSVSFSVFPTCLLWEVSRCYRTVVSKCNINRNYPLICAHLFDYFDLILLLCSRYSSFSSVSRAENMTVSVIWTEAIPFDLFVWKAGSHSFCGLPVFIISFFSYSIIQTLHATRTGLSSIVYRMRKTDCK